MQAEVEQELIRKCRAGDARFYEPLVRAYTDRGMRLALGMLGNRADAEDALQEAFVKAYGSLGRFDLDRAFAPWFFQILRNQCRDMLRTRRARFSERALEDELEERLASEEDDPARLAERSATKRIVWKALERIGAEHREILVLKELEGFRYAEIASVLGIPEGTVASRLYHARQALKKVLVDMNVQYP